MLLGRAIWLKGLRSMTPHGTAEMTEEWFQLPVGVSARMEFARRPVRRVLSRFQNTATSVRVIPVNVSRSLEPPCDRGYLIST